MTRCRTLAAALLVCTLGACESRLDTRGNLPDPERLAEIQAGSHTRQEVGEILGSPSSKTNVNEEAWYYISKRTETFAFFEPEVKERKVIIVRFDSDGVVSSIDALGLEESRNVPPVERKTPTSGNELTFIEQMFGNIGRFNK